ISAQPASLVYFLGRMLRPTHHADVLENWGVLWMCQGVKSFLLCALTAWLAWRGLGGPFTFLTLWSIGLVVWGVFFWHWRRRGGPVTFVERQMAHAWGAGVCGCIGLFLVEMFLGLPPLSLSPVIAILGAMVFIVKGGTLSGSFYFAALALLLTA